MADGMNVKNFGAHGNGISDDWAAIQTALNAAEAANSMLIFPPGVYRHTQPLVLLNSTSKILLVGAGANVSVLLAATPGIRAISFSFLQDGQLQPWGVEIRDLGFRTSVAAGTAIRISYGNPVQTSDHYQPSTIIRGVAVMSGSFGSWGGGIEIEAAWNVTMSEVYVSGDSRGGVWNDMSGAGIHFRRMCVNAHLSNVKCNFWATGFLYSAEGGSNTEGLFFTNCSMVAVQRGVWIIGNPGAIAPRMTTMTWTGGMIELRVGGVTGGSAAFHLQHVWTALVVACQFITEMVPETHLTFGMFLDNCHGVVLSGCDVNAFHYGIYTVGICKAILSAGNTFTNTGVMTCFNGGTSRSRSYGHVCPYWDIYEEDWAPAGNNKLGFVN